MPRTRHDIDRDRKVEEILGVAESQLLAGGYGSLSMVGVARELGVAHSPAGVKARGQQEAHMVAVERLAGEVGRFNQRANAGEFAGLQAA